LNILKCLKNNKLECDIDFKLKIEDNKIKIMQEAGHGDDTT